jgi:hypothetical protein
MSVSAGTQEGKEAEDSGKTFKITTPGFIPHWPGTYELAYTVYDGCHAPATTVVKVNAQCSSDTIKLPMLTKVDTSFDCQKPGGTLGFNGGFTAVSLQGARTEGLGLETGAKEYVGAYWSTEKTDSDETGWQTPSCVIPPMPTNSKPSSCTQWRNAVDKEQMVLLPESETVESCCKCVFGSASTINVAPCGSSSSSATARSGLEALREVEGSNLSLLLGLIIPLGLLLVFSVALNVYLLNDSRRKSPQLQADSSNRDVELSIAPSRNV